MTLHRCIVRAPAAALLLIAIVGCSTTPPTHYHSLLAPPLSSGTAAKVVAAPSVQFEVLQVTVPVQVDVRQIVVRQADNSMSVLEHERWIAPLGDEIRELVTLRVEQTLLQGPPGPVADRSWRVRLDVQRFDSMLGRAASVQAVWSLHAAGGGAVALRCQVTYEQPVGAGVVALTAGHRALFEQLGDAIGQALKVAAGGGTPSCG